MSAAVVSATPNPSTSALSILLNRLKVGLAITGWIGLLLGSVFGLLAARPELLAARLDDDWRLGLLFRIGFALLIGLIEGFAVRRVMHDAHPIARFLTALMGVMLATAAFEVIDSQPSFSTIVFELTSRAFARLLILLIAFGALGVFTAMFAWLDVPFALPTLRPAVATPTAAPSRERRARQQSTSTGQGHVARRPPAQERAVNRARQARSASSNIPTPQRIEVQPRPPEVAPKPTRARRKSKVKLRLGRTVTSICPYCLEEVLPNDPHGRKVCRVCGTAHHGDCWAITGRCAVPHM